MILKKIWKVKMLKLAKTSIRRRLNEVGAKFSKPMSKPMLTEKHRINRLKWEHQNVDRNWDEVIFSDETTLFLNRVKGRVWNLPGRKKVVRTVSHPINVNVWGCFSSKGFGHIVCFRRNLNAELMFKIYKNGLLPTARNHFDFGLSPWKLQEDNDNKHLSKLAVDWSVDNDNDVQKIDWPAMST